MIERANTLRTEVDRASELFRDLTEPDASRDYLRHLRLHVEQIERG